MSVCPYYRYIITMMQVLGFGNAKGRVLLVDTSNWSVIRDFHAAMA